MNLGFSSSLAFVLGILLPVLGLVRGATATDADLPAFFADLICGGMLLFGAVKTRQRAHSGQKIFGRRVRTDIRSILLECDGPAAAPNRSHCSAGGRYSFRSNDRTDGFRAFGRGCWAANKF